MEAEGFVGESVNQPMESEGDGLATMAKERGKKQPPSPSTLSDVDDSSTGEDDDDDWLPSGNEEDEDHGNTGEYPPFTVDDIPRPSYDFQQQRSMVLRNLDARCRGPRPTVLFPAFKSGNGKQIFASEYNLGDKSEISASNVEDCSNKCLCWPMDLVQFIDVKIAGYRHSRPGCAKIFGFIAARGFEPFRNYIYKRGIGNCEHVSVKQEMGVAHLSLNSPTRVIAMHGRALIEFELHALGEDEKGGDEDLIIEGYAMLVDYMHASGSFVEHRRLYNEKCALDFKYAVLLNAVEARVNIEVLRVPSQGVDLKLYAKTSGFSDIIRLFKGAVSEVGFSMSFAVAVELDSSFDLYIKGSSEDDHGLGQKSLRGSWRHNFCSDYHGTEESLAKLGHFAQIAVKVTWICYEKTFM